MTVRLKRLARLGLFGIAMALGPQGQGAMANETELTQAAFARLDTAMAWLVENGEAQYAALGRAAFKTMLIRDFQVNLWVNPTGAGLPEFRIKARGINYDILVAQQAERGGQIYEQWVVRISARDWAGAGPGCRFFLTRKTLGRQREVLRRGDDYAEVFLAKGAPYRFESVDLVAAYRLGAWHRPGCYGGTDLAKTEVYYTADGVLAARPAGNP